MIVQKLRDKIKEFTPKSKDGDRFELDGIIAGIFAVLEDGKVTTDDYEALVNVMEELADEVADIIDIPLATERMEAHILKLILVYVLRAGFRYTNIPLPGE